MERERGVAWCYDYLCLFVLCVHFIKGIYYYTQMEILEARQLELLSLKKDAEDKLAMIEKKTTEFGDAMCDGNDDGYSAVSSNGLLTGEVIPKPTTDNYNQTQNGGCRMSGCLVYVWLW
jgi:hypothetical protein